LEIVAAILSLKKILKIIAAVISQEVLGYFDVFFCLAIATLFCELDFNTGKCNRELKPRLNSPASVTV